MTETEQQERDERMYENGSRMAWLLMLKECLRHLGVDDVDAGKARWVSERTEAIAMLRQVCEDHGDNDWDDNLHLADIIDKHLLDHLEASAAEVEAMALIREHGLMVRPSLVPGQWIVGKWQGTPAKSGGGGYCFSGTEREAATLAEAVQLAVQALPAHLS